MFADDVKRHGMGYVHFVRSPYAHARIVSVDVSAAEALDGVYGTLTPDEVAELTDPFFELTTPPGSEIKDYALAVGRVRHIGEPVVAVVAETRELARDAADLVEVEYEPLDVIVDARKAQDDGAPLLHDDAGTNVVWSGTFDWGDVDGALKAADRVVKIEELHFDRFSSTPLECSAALVEHDRGTGQFTLHCNHQMPGVAAIWMGPALRVPLDKLRFVTQDIGGGFGNKITTHTYLTACCLLARKLKRPIQWTEWRTDQHTANAHGNERWFHDIEVAVQNDGTMLGFKVKALDDCGAFPRYEPLGCIIWAQVTPGLYRWRNIRVDFTQVVTNKSPVAPNRGYSRMQQLWLTERICDIVAHELGLDPVEVRKKNYVRTDEMPYETPNGCVYDSGDYARCLDIALELIDYDARPRAPRESTERNENGKLIGIGIGSTLDSGTNNFGQSTLLNPELQFSGNNEVATIKLDIFGEIVLTLGTVPQGQGHETVASQVAGRHPRRLARPDPRPAGPRLVLELARRLLRDVREPVRGHRARGGQGRGREALARDPPARGRRARRRRPRRHRPRGRLREAQGQPRGGAAVHGLRRDHQREQRGAPARAPRHHAQLPLRLRAAVRDARPGAQVRQPDADLRDPDPRLRGRDRPGDGRGRDRRLRGCRRLRDPDPPADRRGPGARRDRARDRRRPARDVRLRRVRAAADVQLLRLPRPPRARPAGDQDRAHREPLAVLVARDEGDGRGRRRRDPRDLRGDPGRAARRGHDGGRQRLVQPARAGLADAPDPGGDGGSRGGNHQ